MRRQRQLATWSGAILGVCLALLVGAHGQDSDRVTEEFHHVYPISAEGRVQLENINGGVHISSWDRNEVKVDAIKSATNKQRLDEANIQIEAGAGSISIRTQYPEHSYSSNSDRSNNPASVEYTLTVPRRTRLDEIKLINGSLDIHDVSGEVRASCINGHLEARNLAGAVKLSSVNGQLEVSLVRLGDSPVELSSVNGSLDLTLPSDSKADLEASSMQGGIHDDFGLGVHHHLVGHNLRGELGGGGTRIKLSNVNGRIEIHHASDGRSLSPAKDFDNSDNDHDDI